LPQVRTVPFAASGQLVGLLGKKLINENSVAVLELIKNAYDADASEVTIKFSHLGQPAESRIVVEDDGDGMTADEIESVWMTAGISPKRQQVLDRKRTARGRVLLGEMGIGRFATQRLGNSLILVSKKAGSPEATLRVNWDEFEYADRLADVECKIVEEDAPRIFVGERTGTRVVMSGTTDTPWSESELEAVNLKIRRLLMPGAQPPDFAITLDIPEYPRFERLDTPASIERFHFSLSGEVDASGVGHFEVITDVRERKSTNVEVNLWNRIDHEPGVPPRCGPFHLNVRVFMKQKSELRLKGVKPTDVKDLSGVSVFRDGFRVLPYGDPGDDWLQLDKRRINDMSKKFGNDQIIGFVSISAENNIELLDQANRLGLQKNASYNDFTRLILQALSELEKRSFDARQTIIVRRNSTDSGHRGSSSPTPLLSDARPLPVNATPREPLVLREREAVTVSTTRTATPTPGKDARVPALESVVAQLGSVTAKSQEQIVLTKLGTAISAVNEVIETLAPDP
jgi:hypothetical protein